MGFCEKHLFEPAVATCRDCGTLVCAECVHTVPRKTTVCLSCALVRAGIRRPVKPAGAGLFRRRTRV